MALHAKRPLFWFVSTYSLAHFLVDAACAYLVICVLNHKDNAVLSMLLYNGFAFALQAPIGLLIDKRINPKWVARIGLVLVALAFWFSNSIFVALFCVGLGNAMYHVGGGSLVLSISRFKATFAGLYVAPGGIGLALGTYLGLSNAHLSLWFFPLLLLSMSLLLTFTPTPIFEHSVKGAGIQRKALLVGLLLLLPILLRSLVGLSMDFPWKVDPTYMVLLVAALALGKVFGGMLADRFGLLNVGVGGMLVAAPLLAFFHLQPILGILGACIFNFTMPITLVALAAMMPSYKGLSFGLTTTALFVGSIPILIGWDDWLKNNWLVFAFTAASAFLLFLSLYFWDKSTKIKV